MNARTETPALDKLLDAVGDAAGRLRFIQALASSRAWVIADRDWDGYRRPERGTQVLMVSDGADRSRPMAAVFTLRGHAESYLKSMPESRHAFRHPAEPPMAWVLLGLPPGAGIMVNPGSSRAFRINHEAVAELRRETEAVLAQAQSGSRGLEPHPLLLKVQQLLDADDLPGAEAGFAELAASGIGQEYVLATQALISKYRSDYTEAKRLLKSAIGMTRDPQVSAEFWWLLSQVSIDARTLDEAEQAFQHAADLDPSRTDYLTDLAHFRAERHGPEAALAMLHAAAETRPDEPAFPLHIGKVLMDAGRLEEALSAFDALMLKHPEAAAAATYNRAICLQILGRLDEARTSLEQALTLDPNLNGHHQYANLLKTATGGLPASQAYIQLLERRAQEDMPVNARIDSYFTLARIHESAGDFSRAFECMQRANTLKRSTLKWSLAEADAEFGRIIKLFDRDFIARFRGRVASDLKPVFVLGMPRSGTTLTEQILAAHTQINAGGELNHLTRLGSPFTAAWSSAAALAPEKQQEVEIDLSRIAREFFALTAGLQSPGKRFTDKMPGNFLYMGLIYLLFPGASVVHCMRDPVDNCLSCYERQFSKGLFFSYDLKELAGYYRLYRRIMRHWREVLPQDFILDVQYEEMVSDPETQIRRLLAFCSLPFEEACMNFHEVKRTVKTASVLQVRQPMYKTSVARWKKYGRSLTPLLEALGPELPGT